MLTWEHDPVEAFELLGQSNLADVSTQASQESRMLHESTLARANRQKQHTQDGI